MAVHRIEVKKGLVVSQADLLDKDLSQLSGKQREVLDLVLDRRTNKEIAALLRISPSAVEQRLQSVRRRLGVQSRADLARTYQAILDTCAIHTGGKLQVGEPTSPNQKNDREIEGSQGDNVTKITFSEEDLQWSFERDKLAENFLSKLDHIAGIPGRVAAITVAATSMALMLAVVTRLSNAF